MRYTIRVFNELYYLHCCLVALRNKWVMTQCSILFLFSWLTL